MGYQKQVSADSGCFTALIPIHMLKFHFYVGLIHYIQLMVKSQ